MQWWRDFHVACVCQKSPDFVFEIHSTIRQDKSILAGFWISFKVCIPILLLSAHKPHLYVSRAYFSDSGYFLFFLFLCSNARIPRCFLFLIAYFLWCFLWCLVSFGSTMLQSGLDNHIAVLAHQPHSNPPRFLHFGWWVFMSQGPSTWTIKTALSSTRSKVSPPSDYGNSSMSGHDSVLINAGETSLPVLCEAVN